MSMIDELLAELDRLCDSDGPQTIAVIESSSGLWISPDALDRLRESLMPSPEADREAHIRNSPSTRVYDDIRFLLELLDEERAATSELEDKLQIASQVAAAALASQVDGAALKALAANPKALHGTVGSGSPPIDADAWLEARAEQQFRRRAPSNNWIERLDGDYIGRL
jgi:hypothetical protein